MQPKYKIQVQNDSKKNSSMQLDRINESLKYVYNQYLDGGEVKPPESSHQQNKGCDTDFIETQRARFSAMIAK